MRIALVCTEKLPVPAVAGGAIQIYIDGILPYLAKQHRITVFGIQYPGLPAEEVRNSVRYIRVPAKNTAEYVANLKAKITPDFDLIHVFNRPLFVLALSKDLPLARFSLSLHNEMFHPGKISAEEARKCVDRVEFINTVSNFIAGSVLKRVPEAQAKLNVVYSGADVNLYKPVWTPEGRQNRIELKKKYGLEGYRVVLFIGRLSVKKGLHVLLQAMKKVMENDPKAALVIVGSKWYGDNRHDEYTRSLNTLAKELRGPVVFTGFLPPAEIPAHYNLGDIFVCPSQWDEPLARVHYEAMAAGLPILTTNRGGNAEVIVNFKNGIVVDDYANHLAFADNINKLFSNKEKIREMGRTGRKFAEEKYNWKRVAREIFPTIPLNPPEQRLENHLE